MSYQCPACFGTFDHPDIQHYTQLGMEFDTEHHEFCCPRCGRLLVHETDLAVFDVSIKRYEIHNG